MIMVYKRAQGVLRYNVCVVCLTSDSYSSVLSSLCFIVALGFIFVLPRSHIIDYWSLMLFH